MSEFFANINFNGEKVEASVDNTSVYRHIGHYALFDHVFIAVGESTGGYIWANHPSYEQLSTAAVESGCELHLNIRDVAEIDRTNYERNALSDLTDTFPAEWLPEV